MAGRGDQPYALQFHDEQVAGRLRQLDRHHQERINAELQRIRTDPCHDGTDLVVPFVDQRFIYLDDLNPPFKICYRVNDGARVVSIMYLGPCGGWWATDEAAPDAIARMIIEDANRPRPVDDA